MKKNVLVIGSSGALGKLICSELNQHYRLKVNLYVGDYLEERGKQTAQEFEASFCLTELTDENKLTNSISKMDAVIVAIKQHEPIIQKCCFKAKVLCVDVTAFSSFANKIKEIYKENRDFKSPSVVMAGCIPGLSGLLLKKAVENSNDVHNVDVAFIQNSNAIAGFNGILDMLRIISQPVTIAAGKESKQVPGFIKKLKFKLLTSKDTYTLRLINHPEKEYLSDRFTFNNINYWTSWNNKFLNVFLEVLNFTGILKKLVNKKKYPILGKFKKKYNEKDETAYLQVVVTSISSGIKKIKKYQIRIFSDYKMTAKIVVLLAMISEYKNKKGVLHPCDIMSLDEVLDIIDDSYAEFVEIDQENNF